MTLLAFGINHNTAPVEVRERVAFAVEQLPSAMRDAQQKLGLEEISILSTCNRTEIYSCSHQPAFQGLLQWLAEYHKLDSSALQSSCYHYEKQEAVRHIMRVACGLDSMILGEPQILGQLKSAYHQAQSSGLIGAQLARLFQQTFNVAKAVRTQTTIGQNPVSVAYAAVTMAQHVFADLTQTPVLLIGSGETIELVAKHLYRAGARQMIVANRTPERAQILAESFNAHAIGLSEIVDVLPRVDIVISSTASQLPILGKGVVESSLKKRRHHPYFMVDLAVPRDIEPQVNELDDVYLYTVDDLKDVIQENQRNREMAAFEAEQIIDLHTHEYMQHIRALDAVDTLTKLRENVYLQRDRALMKAMKQLQAGKSPETVLTQFAYQFSNQILHQPTVFLRESSAKGRTDVQDWVKELFQLDTPSDSD